MEIKKPGAKKMKFNKESGFSLIELLISIILFGFISAGVMIAMRTSFRTTTVSRNLDEIGINVSQALSIMKHDIQEAGRYVSQGIVIPNNPVNTSILYGFDRNACHDDLSAPINISTLSGTPLGQIPEDTDVIAFVTMAPPDQLGLIGCDPSGPPAGPQPVSVNYIAGANVIEVDDGSDFACYMANTAQRPVFAILFTSISNNILSEMFTIENINANTLEIANDTFSNGTLSREYLTNSAVYLIGANPNACKIEYFILESNQPNPKDPNTPLRHLAKRINNREVYIVSDNITNLQAEYVMYDGSRIQDIASEPLSNSNFPVVVEIMLSVRSDDMVRGNEDSPADIDPVTLTDRARYIEETHHTIITVKGMTYKPTNEVATPYYP